MYGQVRRSPFACKASNSETHCDTSATNITSFHRTSQALPFACKADSRTAIPK